ncbi:protein kinase family protein [Actinomadura harenae]|uniref:hypothetical protein n=1 Tax=Actinomadura harenae TaxID=2483351 RepID=UPI001F323CF6|nr:hypothetical protein [Actinomadura harenae]
MIQRVNWEDLRHLIEQHTGPVCHAQPVSEGRNSEVAVIVRTDSGTTFVKGLREDHPRAWTQERERLVNPYVRPIAPELLWSHQGDGWSLLGFEYIAGRSIDYAPGSADLLKLTEAMQRLQRIDLPPIELKRAEQRWAAYTDRPELFAGDALLHTEWTPSNVLVTDDSAWIIDWAWPTRGAAWIDPACWVIWLIASGHPPAEAETWAARMPSWSSAPYQAVTEFACAQTAMWRGIASDNGEPWTRDMAEAAHRWTEHRT